MTVIKVNIGQDIPDSLWHAIEALPPNAPVVAMVHGFRYSPRHARCNPHRHILSLTPAPTRRAHSWPEALGFGGDHAGGIALAIGWEARGSLKRAYRKAAQAGAVLAELADQIQARSGRPLSIIGHSLGARVALQTLPHAAPGSIGRMVLLTGAEFQDEADRVMTSPAGRAAEVINVTSRENDLFDFALELLIAGGRRRAIGSGLSQGQANWVDLQIDCRETLTKLDLMGFPMDQRILRLSHWTPYLREGVFDFYRTALCRPWVLPLSALRGSLPSQTTARWSRLFAAQQAA